MGAALSPSWVFAASHSTGALHEPWDRYGVQIQVPFRHYFIPGMITRGGVA